MLSIPFYAPERMYLFPRIRLYSLETDFLLCRKHKKVSLIEFSYKSWVCNHVTLIQQIWTNGQIMPKFWYFNRLKDRLDVPNLGLMWMQLMDATKRNTQQSKCPTQGTGDWWMQLSWQQILLNRVPFGGRGGGDSGTVGAESCGGELVTIPEQYINH